LSKVQDELTWRAANQDLVVPVDRLTDLADHLADVVVGNFELTRRTQRRWCRGRRESR
jgi:hypothetical protein